MTIRIARTHALHRLPGATDASRLSGGERDARAEVQFATLMTAVDRLAKAARGLPHDRLLDELEEAAKPFRESPR